MAQHLNQIITHLTDNDTYKISMGQMFLHQYPDAFVEWTYKNRNPDTHFTQEMIDEINYQIDLYCQLRFTKEELDYLRSWKYIKSDYVDYLSIWHPQRSQITCVFDKEKQQPEIHFHGPNVQVSWYEVPVMAIVAEVYFRMNYTQEEQEKAMEEAKRRLQLKIDRLANGELKLGAFSEFGTRRRFCKSFQEYAIKTLAGWQFSGTKFVGTSNVYFAMKYGVTPCGTMAHEAIELVGQGYPFRNPSYSNYYMMKSWVKEYGVQNGIYLTDCITTDCFLKDFNDSYATLFSGLRHDSGDPVEWGEKMLMAYQRLGIDTRNKTLLFSDALDFEKADMLYQRFSGRCKVAFGIGTNIVSDNGLPIMNQVIKLTEVNGIPVVKISDTQGKSMGKSEEYRAYLQRCIDWRVQHG